MIMIPFSLHFACTQVSSPSLDNPHHTLSSAESLLKACRNGVLDKVIYLIEDNAVDIECKDRYDQTPLSFACENGHLEVVKFLVKHNADIESKDILGRTPLSYACSLGNLEVVKFLVEHSADVDSKDKNGKTPLIHAGALLWRSNRLPIVLLLIEHNAKVDQHTSGEAQHYLILRKALRQSGSVKFKVVKVMLTGWYLGECVDLCCMYCSTVKL